MIVVECRAADVRALQSVGHRPADEDRDWRGVCVKKPWGYEQEVWHEGALSIWKLTLVPGAETSMHAHPRKKTVLMVQSGECVIETLCGRHELRAGDMAHIEPGAFHRTRTAHGVVLLEVESPPIKSDLVRLEDRYGRGQGYECA